MEDALRPVTPPQQAAADLARIKEEKLPIPAGAQAALAEHYQALLRTMGIEKAWFAFWASEVIACAYSLWATKKELRNKGK